MVGKFKLGLKCRDWLSVGDNMGNIGNQIWNVTDLGSVVICREHAQGTLQMCLTYV